MSDIAYTVQIRNENREYTDVLQCVDLRKAKAEFRKQGALELPCVTLLAHADSLRHTTHFPSGTGQSTTVAVAQYFLDGRGFYFEPGKYGCHILRPKLFGKKRPTDHVGNGNW